MLLPFYLHASEFRRNSMYFSVVVKSWRSTARAEVIYGKKKRKNKNIKKKKKKSTDFWSTHPEILILVTGLLPQNC